MFKHPYETTACSGYRIGNIATALQHADIDHQLRLAQSGKGVHIEGLYEVPPYVKQVEQFAHAVPFDRNGRTQLAIDVRPFTRVSRDGELVVTAPSDRNFAVLRGRLARAWLDGMQGDLASVGDLAVMVYQRHVPQAIVTRFGLSGLDQQHLAVLATYFYFGQFDTQLLIPENEINRYAMRISRVTSINTAEVLQILDRLVTDTDHHPHQYPRLRNLDDLVAAIKKTSPNPRLESLNVGLLLSATVGGWWGPAASEIMAVGLEYPPTWLALVYTALQDRSFNGARFTKLVQQVDRRDLGKQFQVNLAALLDAHSPDHGGYHG